MKRFIKNSQLILGVLFLLNASLSQGQNNTDFTMLNSKQHLLTSSFNKKEYVVNVLLPASYNTADSVSYPVLYILDGKYSTTSFYSMKETFALGNEVKKVIYVTVDNNVKSQSDWLTNRYTDLTPSNHPPSDTAIARFFKLPVVPSGGAANMLSTIEKDVIPFIEKTYKTNKERGLFGHSLGGLFATYCLLTKPTLFQKYSINSPSIWWNNGETIALAGSVAKEKQSVNAKIFVSSGALEGSFMNTPINNFLLVLKNNFPNVKVTSKLFEEETHLSVVHAASSRTLKILYAQ